MNKVTQHGDLLTRLLAQRQVIKHMGVSVSWDPGKYSNFICKTYLAISRILMCNLNRTKFQNRDQLFDLIQNKNERGLLTVSNHSSRLDDPMIWSLLTWKNQFNLDKLRWTTAAADVCFKKQFHTDAMGCGKVVPIIRGDGVYQKPMDFCAKLLEAQQWVHLFPEAIARRLGQDGAKVMISSRKQENVDKTVSTLQSEDLDVSGVVCHVGKSEDRNKLVEQTLARFGGIDILVSNAAANPAFGPILDTTEAAWDKIFETNVKAAFFLCKEIVPHMEKRGGGSVVFISSFAGYLPMEFLGPYSVSKTALFGLTKALVPQLSTMNIRVNCVAPGIIKTKFSEQLWKNEAVKDMVMQMIPMKRIGDPNEIGGFVSFLSSDDSSYITGECTLVTGGIPGRL